MLGFLSYINPQRWFLISAMVILITPSGTALSSFNVFEGIYYYDSYFVGILIGVMLSVRQNESILIYRDYLLELSLLILFLYLVSYIGFSEFKHQEFKFLIKDFRPFILAIEFWVIYELVIKQIKVDETIVKSIKTIIVIVLLSNILKIIYISSVGISTEDAFYLANSYRYLDAVTYVAAVYLLVVFSGSLDRERLCISKEYLFISVLLSTSVLLIANSRIVLFSIFLTTIIYSLNKPGKAVSMVTALILFVVIFISFSFYFEAERIMHSMTYEGVIRQISSRYSPFINVLQEWSAVNYIFGAGIGVPFEIPWFEYREYMDNFNANIDSSYVTYYFKFGMLSVLIIFMLLRSFIPYPVVVKGRIILFMSVIFIFSATHYQIYAVGIFLGVALLSLLLEGNNVRK